MKIQFYKVHHGNNVVDSATGECASIDDAKKQFADFLKNHGSRIDDYDEFHCRFVEERQCSSARKTERNIINVG